MYHRNYKSYALSITRNSRCMVHLQDNKENFVMVSYAARNLLEE